MKDLMPVITSNDGRFYNGNPATGEQGTRVTAEFLNDVQDHLRNIQEELKSILAAVGMTPNAQVQNQVYQAIKKIFSANLYDGVDSIAIDLGVTARVANELSKSIETIDNGKVSKAGDTMIGNLTTPNVVLTANANKSLNNVIEAVSALFVGDRSRFQSLVNAWGTSGVTPLGVSYDFSNPNGWWIKFGPLYGNLIIQGGLVDFNVVSNVIVTLPIVANKTLFALNAQVEGITDYAPELFYGWNTGGADNKTKIRFVTSSKLNYKDTQEWIAICVS